MSLKVYILLLNWNGWRDTIECLESVFRSDYPDFQVIVCDNGSSDASLDHIRAWADGKEVARAAPTATIARLTDPPIPKPVAYLDVLSGSQPKSALQATDASLVLIQTGENLGFAGGNNVGLRYVETRDDFAYVWLLNNDTVVEPDALSQLVARLSKEESGGICGSTLLYYHAPDTVQALGGAGFNKWRGKPTEIGKQTARASAVDAAAVEAGMAYVAGASMLVSKHFLSAVGLLCEDYFLYFEELDWAMRARGRFSLHYAPASVVYHKEGAAIGTGNSETRSALAEFHSCKSKLFLTRKFFPEALITVYLATVLQVAKRLLSRDFSRARALLNALLGLKA